MVILIFNFVAYVLAIYSFHYWFQIYFYKLHEVNFFCIYDYLL